MRSIILAGVRVVLAVIVIAGYGRMEMALAEDESNMLTAGGRYHVKQSAFDDLPFGNGDISYLVAYSYLLEASIWQFGLDAGPDISGKMPETGKNVRFALTPQFNLIFRDSYFRGGAGIRTTYLRDDDGEGKWFSPYWQLQLGLCFPIYKSFSVDIGAYYVMEQWPKIAEFRFNDLEYGLSVNYAF
jgi:hypothetical protein